MLGSKSAREIYFTENARGARKDEKQLRLPTKQLGDQDEKKGAGDNVGLRPDDCQPNGEQQTNLRKRSRFPFAAEGAFLSRTKADGARRRHCAFVRVSTLPQRGFCLASRFIEVANFLHHASVTPQG